MHKPKSTCARTTSAPETAPLPRVTDMPFFGVGASWTLPATGGYDGGCIAGKAAAELYMREYLRPIQQAGAHHLPTLQKVALGIAERMAAAATPAERESLRGQAVGFFAHLDSYLLWTSAWLDETPPDRTASALREQLQAGLERGKRPARRRAGGAR